MRDRKAGFIPFEPPFIRCFGIELRYADRGVSKILGHTNITTTQIYAKVTNAKLENDISAFESKISGRFVL